MGGLNLHEALWSSNLDLVQACLTHPFVQALGDASLETDLFSTYVAQDAFFLRSFLKAYALALARSDDTETAATFYELMGGVLEEIKIHRLYAAELGIDLECAAPNPACRAYTDFLLRAAWHSSLGDAVAAMTPCMRLYAYLGGKLASQCRQGHPYRRWIEAYSGAEFERLAARLEALLDQTATDSRDLRDTYRYALRCELAFFSGVLAP